MNKDRKDEGKDLSFLEISEEDFIEEDVTEEDLTEENVTEDDPEEDDLEEIDSKEIDSKEKASRGKAYGKVYNKMKANEDTYGEEDYDEDDDGDDYEDEDDRPMNPLMVTGIFLGLIILAALICALLWRFSHGSRQDKTPEYSTENMDETLSGNDVEYGTGENIPANPVETETGENQDTENRTESTDGIQGTEDGAQQSGEEEHVPEGNGGTTADPSPAENGAGAGQDGEASAREPISGNESMQFTETADTVTAKDVTNMRSVPSTLDSENVVAQLKNGETIARTGVNDTTGWSRLDYNGQTVYAVTQYLTTDLTYKTPVSQGNPNRITTQDGRVIIFTDCDDNVTPKEYVNLRVEPSTSQGNDTVRCQINNGTNVHRTGYSPDSGWSRVEYNGEVLYVVSSMVNTVTLAE